MLELIANYYGGRAFEVFCQLRGGPALPSTNVVPEAESLRLLSLR